MAEIAIFGGGTYFNRTKTAIIQNAGEIINTVSDLTLRFRVEIEFCGIR